VFVAASVDGVDCGVVNGEVMAVLAFPYAEETAVPIVENCPFTALVVDASVPATPAPGAASPPIVRVGQMDDFIPGDVVHPIVVVVRTTTQNVSFNGLRVDSLVSMFKMT
jgi:hypothetical protein